MKVKVNSLYTYNPVGYDVFDPKTQLPPGSRVRVVNCRGCPPANTMGQCYVGDPVTGAFIGMVSTGSLTK